FISEPWYNMSRFLLISLGQLNGHILEAVARSGAFTEILVAGRDPARGLRKTNQARIGAAVEGHYPAISFVKLDVNDASASAILRETAPDVALAAPSMLPWWRIDRLTGPRAEAARAVPFAGWIACHLAPMLAVRRAWAESGLKAPWVGASYPDVVNTILHRSGPGPVCGVGNVDEVIPKIRFIVAKDTGCDPATVNVHLVAQHALEYFVYRETGTPAAKGPPFMLRAELDGRDVSDIAARAIFEPMPIPYELDFNLLTASSALKLLPALAGHGLMRMHVPAPNGLPGGYPVRVEAGRVSLDLPACWAKDDAIANNLSSLPWDGLQSIESDGTVVFTQATSRALFDLTGRHYESLAPENAETMANELVSAVK
ncbi:MAG: hypothetical protein KAT39_07850, partial [Alphaproteobacteria bacterium]|nr:hypothetical protein [Alphaproteobacteria bacterium]